MTGKTWSIKTMVNGVEIQAILDSGATLSAVSKSCIPESALKKSTAVPIQVGSGDTIYSLGETNLQMNLGSKTIFQTAVVIETTAFQAVLGTDFLSNPRVGGLITQPPPTRLLVDGELFEVQETQGTPTSHRVYRLFKKEGYSLTDSLRDEVLRELEVPKACFSIDVFANFRNCKESKYMTRENSAWRYNWSALRKESSEVLWANPPFSQLSKVLTKLCMEPTRMVIVTPSWSDQ